MKKLKRSGSSRSNAWNLALIGLGIAVSLVAAFFLNKFQLQKDQPFPDDCLPPSGRHLLQIARPRPSGSSGSTAVQSYIKSQFNSQFWHFEADSTLVEETPAGPVTFTNLIFTLKSPSTKEMKRILLAAHYDSKILEAHGRADLSVAEIRARLQQSSFIGATDSAFACALMLSLAQEVQKIPPATLHFLPQFVFFDGEEAMLHWSAQDSLYGSRSLAEKWSQPGHPHALASIELMILMDLLGSGDTKEATQATQGNHPQPQSQLYSFHAPGSKLDQEFQQLVSIERSVSPHSAIFSDSSKYSHLKGFAIEDDHLPFLQRGVPVLHLIPVPFPSVWHTPADDLDALDREVCERTATVMLEYLKWKLTQ